MRLWRGAYFGKKRHLGHFKGKYRNILRGWQGFGGIFAVFFGESMGVMQERAVFRLKIEG